MELLGNKTNISKQYSLKQIYRILLSNSFQNTEQDNVYNQRMSIVRTLTDSLKRYVEIYEESWGFSVHIFGEGFNDRFYPTSIDIWEKDDLGYLDKVIKEKKNLKIETTNK